MFCSAILLHLQYKAIKHFTIVTGGVDERGELHVPSVSVSVSSA